MRRFRRLARWMVPGWVLLWLAASLNLLSICCADDVRAAEIRADSTVHEHAGTSHAHGHADYPSGHPCTVTLTERDVPLAPGASTSSEADESSAPVLPAGETTPRHWLLRPQHRALHGPPPDRRQIYLHTLRLRI